MGDELRLPGSGSLLLVSVNEFLDIERPQRVHRGLEAGAHDSRHHFTVQTEMIGEEEFVILRRRVNVNIID